MTWSIGLVQISWIVKPGDEALNPSHPTIWHIPVRIVAARVDLRLAHLIDQLVKNSLDRLPRSHGFPCQAVVADDGANDSV